MVVVYFLTFLSLFGYGISVPPSVCFENFNWDDCGRAPVHVMYYYKPGSRCEIGVWRGCYPNQNMFKDEYECINTCIFVERAGPENYHQGLKLPDNIISDDSSYETVAATVTDNVTTVDTTLAANDTSETAANDTAAAEGNTTTILAQNTTENAINVTTTTGAAANGTN